jgi:hypothetical protein
MEGPRRREARSVAARAVQPAWLARGRTEASLSEGPALPRLASPHGRCCAPRTNALGAPGARSSGWVAAADALGTTRPRTLSSTACCLGPLRCPRLDPVPTIDASEVTGYSAARESSAAAEIDPWPARSRL